MNKNENYELIFSFDSLRRLGRKVNVPDERNKVCHQHSQVDRDQAQVEDLWDRPGLNNLILMTVVPKN